jgi:hypothetical protein
LKLADLVQRVIIPSRKLTHYALDPNASDGGHKAVIFERALGFTPKNYMELMRQLEEKALQAEATFQEENRFGKLYRVDIDVEGTAGRQGTVRTGWLIPVGAEDEARLVTLYVKRS